MNPRTLDALVLLRRFVSLFPVALRVPPQSGERVRESGRRLGRGERLAELVQGQQDMSRLDVPTQNGGM